MFGKGVKGLFGKGFFGKGVKGMMLLKKGDKCKLIFCLVKVGL